MKRAACLLVLALLAAGCGGGGARLSRSAYQAKLSAAFTAAVGTIKADPRAAGSPSLVAAIAAGYDGIASSLKDLRPPANVQALNDELVAGASKQAATLHALVARIKGKPKAVRERILAQFDPSTVAGQKEFDRAVAGLEAKGYRFRPSGGT
jgi:hypothetical protein